MTLDELEKLLKKNLAKNPQISTDDIYIESFFNETEFMRFWGMGPIRSFHNLYISPHGKNWCYSICPLKVYPVSEKYGVLYTRNRNSKNEHFLYHYKTADALYKINEILFLHTPLLLENPKKYFNCNRRQDAKELKLIAEKIEKQDKISFGELVVAQNLINNLEHEDMKFYNGFEYGRLKKQDKDEQYIKNN